MTSAEGLGLILNNVIQKTWPKKIVFDNSGFIHLIHLLFQFEYVEPQHDQWSEDSLWFLVMWNLNAFLVLNIILQKLQGMEIPSRWFLVTCNFNAFLVLHIVSQKLQGMEIPSRWFASMWFFRALFIACLPHIVQLYSSLPSLSCLKVFSIIETHFSSSSCTFPEK